MTQKTRITRRAGTLETLEIQQPDTCASWRKMGTGWANAEFRTLPTAEWLEINVTETADPDPLLDYRGASRTACITLDLPAMKALRDLLNAKIHQLWLDAD